MLPGPWTSDERSPCRHPRGTAPAILDMRVAPMTDTPRVQATAGEPRSRRAGLALPATRYRHPGDVIRLIVAALVLAVAGTITALVPSEPAQPRCRRDQRGRSEYHARAGADRPRSGHDGRCRAGLAGRRIAPPPVPGTGNRRRRLRHGSGIDDGDPVFDRAGPAGRARGPAAGLLADGGWLSQPGRHRRAGRRRRIRGAVAEPAVAPHRVGHAAADRRGASDHRRPVTDGTCARGGGRGDRRGRPARRVRGARPPDGRGGRDRSPPGGRRTRQPGGGGGGHREGIAALHGGDGGRAGPVCQGLRLGPA